MKLRQILETASIPASLGGFPPDLTVYVQSLDLAGIRLDQWWADVRRNRFGPQVVRSFIDASVQEGITPQVLHVLTFARLYPARTTCANRLAQGAHLGKRTFLRAVSALEDRISRKSEITAPELDRTALMLGKDNEYEPAFDELRDKLLASAYHDIREQRHDLPTVMETWLSWERKARRRGKFATFSAAIDCGSLAVRISFHQVYDAFWNRLLDGLRHHFIPQPIFIDFHRLWHTALALPATSPGGDPVYVLNGDCLALHPVGSLLIRTSAGRSIIRNYLEANPGFRLSGSADQPAAREFFAAIAQAINVYDEFHDQQRQNRCPA